MSGSQYGQRGSCQFAIGVARQGLYKNQWAGQKYRVYMLAQGRQARELQRTTAS